MAKPGFAERIVAWQRQQGRHDLPWQKNTSPYRIWISEIMLQQTQVTTVIPYFNRFVNEFPDVKSLAAANEDQVLHLWSGLGYYSRARNLLKAARILLRDYSCTLPRDLDALTSLPGIGRSTAGAILALSWGERHPILDGNARRVLARHAGIAGWPGKRAVEKRLWRVAEQCLPNRDVKDYTQGLMDIGALICTRARPSCEVCPLAADCTALASGQPELLPGKKPVSEKPVRSAHMLLVRNPRGILLERRPSRGVWGGLWSPPQFANKSEANAWVSRNFPELPQSPVPMPKFRHTFSHFHLEVQPILLDIDEPAVRAMEAPTWLWYNSSRNSAIGLAAPVKKLLRKVERTNWKRQ